MRRLSISFAATLLVTLWGAVVSAQQPTPLSITTNSPLAPGMVGSEYEQLLQASGGTPPYSWQIVAGQLPTGLSLNRTTGVIVGVPTRLGTFGFQVRADDNGGQAVQKPFSITIDPQALTITNNATLPAARVGAAYLAQLNAAGGIEPYGNWRVTEGLLPPGIQLLPASGLLSGTPTEFGNFSFSVTVDDDAFESASKAFTLAVEPSALTILTASPLGLGTVGAAYQQPLAAAGGPAPFVWETLGSLPGGLALNASSGVLSGTPSSVGAFQFDVRVTDAASAAAMRRFSLTVADPRATISLQGEQGPAQQAVIALTMATAHPFAIAGQLSLSFQPDAINDSDDAAILLTNGSRTAQFIVRAGETAAAFPGGELGLAIGTTAGVRTISVTAMQTGSQAIPLASSSKLDITIAQSPPTITGATISNRTATGFTTQIAGFSTAREVTRALFRFTPVTGRTLQNTQATVELNGPANAWYQDPTSALTGGAFAYTQPFTIQGDLSAIQSVAITMTNSRGDSQQTTVNF
jgi:hypothetical protein